MRTFIQASTLALLAAPLLTALWSCSALPNAYEARLADHLSETGAKMYGAYWCPHCGAQKSYFGAASAQLPYIECDPQGLSAQPNLCAEMGIEVYPTWIIEGQYYTGAQLPGKLAVLSGFEPPASEPDAGLPSVPSMPSEGYSTAN